MPRRTKKFIDKKNSVTFTLVHRSQKDPETANEDAPQRILVSSKEEQMKYGINYDDDYNYLQHLRDVSEFCDVEQDCFRIGKSSSQALMEADSEKKTQLILPSEVFASLSQNKVGLLNLAAPISGPHPHLDDDILAALDGDVDSNEELEDDFFIKASNESPLELDGCEDYDEDDYNEQEDSYDEEEDGYKEEEDSYRDGSFDGVKNFLNLPLSSGVPKDSTQPLADECYKEFCEKLRMDDDDDDDDDSEDGYTCGSKFASVIEQYLGSATKKEDLKVSHDQERQYLGCASDDEDELVEIAVEIPNKDWDCESFLTTLSTTSNLPKTIGLPKQKNSKSTKRTKNSNDVLSQTDDIVESRTKPLILLRNKTETKEEKKLRKEAIKNDRKVRRMNKVETKEFFKEEKTLIKKQMIQRNANFQGSAVLSQF